LRRVAPYDWHAFFQRNVYEASKGPPADEIERAGWRLVYSAKPNAFTDAGSQWLTYGFNIDKDGLLSDVREGSPAWQAGMAPGMRVQLVEGRLYSSSVLEDALEQAQKTRQPTKFQVSQDGWSGTIAVSYFGGPRYPHLKRIPDKPDLLAEIMAPRAKH
jgi:predicted metalloprotease with PDZ domain